MNASLNKIVTIKAPTFASDGYGGQTVIYSETSKHADVRDLSQSDRLLYGGDRSTNMVVFVFRHFDIDKDSVIVWNSTEYKIESKKFDKDKRYLIVYGRC